ncbi:helix-turn-helix transcriptional regulator [Paenibacillus sp. P32E]|uniref:helix-turn-helix domain-containing protein n=1 Tax=Paenibacillus sp. P32E TaxID=1349434 RepID=UPI000938C21A|nr:helix-turn-helix transcriptional regulator [Paenibacillus sp. P32E]OKP91365.1 hypothetical protein A3848_09670 [Paenibacillus sp. P32E]
MGEPHKNLGLRAARIRAGKTLEEVSILTKLPRENIIGYEMAPGEVPASEALILAKIYHTTVDQICFE